MPGPQQDTFAGLYREHFIPLVRAVALMGVGDPEDIVAEAMIRVFAGFDRIRDPKAAGAYLRRTTINLANNRLRSRRAERAAIARLAIPLDQQAVIPVPDTSTRRAILGLPLRARQVLVLRYWLDLPDSEIAELLNISAATVRTHLSAARAALRQQLSAEQEDE